MMGKTLEEVKKEYEPRAIEAIKSRLALEAVIKAEKIEADEVEVSEKLKEMAKNYGKSEDDEFMKNENVINYIKEGLKSQKALEFLVENAKTKAKSKAKTSTKTSETKKEAKIEDKKETKK